MKLYIDNLISFIIICYFCTFIIWPLPIRAAIYSLILLCELYYIFKINPYYHILRTNIMGIYLLIYIMYIIAHLCFISSDFESLGVGAYQYLFYSSFLLFSLYISKHTTITRFQNMLCLIGVLDIMVGMLEYILQVPLFRNSDNIGFLAEGETYFRASSFFTAPMIFGDWAGIFALSSLNLYHTQKNKLYILLFIIFICGVIISYSRGSWLATLIGLGVYFYLLLKKKNLSRIQKIILYFIIFIGGALYCGNMNDNDVALFNFINSIGDFETNQSNVGRMYAWMLAVDTLTSDIHNLVFGIGFAKTGAFSTSLFVTESGVLKRLVEGGIFFGFIYYTMIVFFMLKLNLIMKNESCEKNKLKLIYLIAVITLILLHDITLQVTEDCSISFAFWYVISWIFIKCNNLTNKKDYKM